jgi:hypothetical protein
MPGFGVVVIRHSTSTVRTIVNTPQNGGRGFSRLADGPLDGHLVRRSGGAA